MKTSINQEQLGGEARDDDAETTRIDSNPVYISLDDPHYKLVATLYSSGFISLLLTCKVMNYTDDGVSPFPI